MPNVLRFLYLLEKLTHSFIIALLFIPFIFNHVVIASSAFHKNITGFDISYPQCDKSYPDTPAFAVIGVNGGRPFTKNKCFQDQYTWALQNYAKPAVYMNLNYISPQFAEYATKGPYNCLDYDEPCRAYNYGFQAAQFAYSDTEGIKTKPAMWWLDVELENTWNDEPILNQQVIQGAIDFLKLKDQHVGVYSTPYQWSQIAGNFKPLLPVWAAGAKNKFTAQLKCQSQFAFTGGEVHMVQYVEDDFDNNHLCPK
jgi:hypothetical protein